MKCNTNRLKAAFWAILPWTLCVPGASAWWFADQVISYDPGPGYWVTLPQFNDPARCLGAPRGLYVDEPDNSSLASLGDGGSITLAFSQDIIDDPNNPYGMDFIVFGNAQFVGGNPYYRWQEPAYVEISQNGCDWYLILPSVIPADLIGGVDTGQSSTVLSGYAEYTPTVGLPQDQVLPSFPVSRTAEELYTVPERPSVQGDSGSIAFDYVSGGGDAFDIANAVVQRAPGTPALSADGQHIPAGIDRFRYIRITDAVVGDSIPGLYEISAEIDAVARVRAAVTIGAAKRLPPGSYVVAEGAIVSAAFDGEFFIQSPDRSAAVRVVSDRPVQAGDALTITGHISDVDGLRSIMDPMFTVTARGSAPAPLGMPLRSTGSDLVRGLLVRTWGKVTDPGDGYYCVIADGERTARVVSEEGVHAPLGSHVAATGICDREVNGQPLIRLTDLTQVN